MKTKKCPRCNQIYEANGRRYCERCTEEVAENKRIKAERKKSNLDRTLHEVYILNQGGEAISYGQFISKRFGAII